MSQERSEQPTQRRREEARRRGEGVGRSTEMAMTAGLGAAILTAPLILPGALGILQTQLRTAVAAIGTAPVTEAVIINHLGDGLSALLRAVVPFMVVVSLAAVAGTLTGGGLVLSTARLTPKLSYMNPLSGLKRMLNRQALVRMGIAIGKLAVLVFVSISVISGHTAGLLAQIGGQPTAIAAAGGATLQNLAIMLLLLLGVIALIDFVIQRRRAQGQIRMTKDEVRQEMKQQEGDPLLKAIRRRRARAMAFSRMMEAVKTADVIVTNPIHIAVALRYDPATMRAPKIVAKGKRLVAERIKATAVLHHVPIIEDVPLARALEPQPLGSDVPPHLYRTVAQVLVLVHQMRVGRRSS